MTIIAAPADQILLVLKDSSVTPWAFRGHGKFDRITVLAWSIDDDGQATPITPYGQFDLTKPCAVHTEASNFIILPDGPVLHDEHDVAQALEHLAKGGTL
jgi:hypothetical protein